MAYARKDYLGTRADTTLNGGINNSTTSITITSATGWPSVSNTGFYAVIDPDVDGSEEKVFVTARTGTGLTVTRGVDGTTAVSHATGATIRPTFSGVDADEANYMVAQTVGTVTTAGQMLKASAANTFTTLDKGSNSTVLAVSSGGTLAYTTAATAMFADSAVSNAKLAGMTRGTVKVGDSSGAASDLALGASGYYLKSDGTDVVWASFTGLTKLRKTSDQSITTTTTDSGLTFAAAAGAYYAFEAYIVFTGATANGDLAVDFRWASGGNDGIIFQGPNIYADDTTQVFAGGGTFIMGGSTGKRSTLMRGTAISAAGDTFQIRWSKGSSGDPTVNAGTYLRYRSIT